MAETTVRVRIKPGWQPWLRIRLAIVCAKLRWYAAMGRLLDGVWEIVR